MKYRRFGRTEIRMPVISCGGMRYQYKWQDVDPTAIPRDNQENLEATIHRAFELGINLLGQGVHWCPGENAAKAGQLNLRTALARSPFADRIPAVLREAHELLFDGPQKRLSRS
jgi:predicted aldo/keto reductase-like oxidoreductase